MAIVNQEVLRLLRRIASGKAISSPDPLLVADGILEHYAGARSCWDAHLVGIQVLQDLAGIEAYRGRLLKGDVDEAAWTFDMTSDAWLAYAAIERSTNHHSRRRPVLVEITSPFDVCDLGDVIASYVLDVEPRIPTGTHCLAIDLATISL